MITQKKIHEEEESIRAIEKNLQDRENDILNVRIELHKRKSKLSSVIAEWANQPNNGE